MKTILTLVILTTLAATCSAQVISVSFAGDNSGGNSVSIGGLTPTDDIAGVVPVGNWNSDADQLATGSLGSLLDDSGTPTTASVQWSGPNNVWGGTGAESPDEMMVNGWLDDNGSGADIQVAGIPYENYDLYVYGSSDAGNENRGMTTRVNGADYYSLGFFETITANGSFFDGTYIDAATEENNPSYFKIGGLSGAELSIFGMRDQAGPELESGTTDYRGGVAGFQIVACDGECEVTTVFPPLGVAESGNIGSQAIDPVRSNSVFGPASDVMLPGLGQSWYAVANPGDKAGVDAVADNNDLAVPYFQSEGGTWWSGADTVQDVQNYPPEVAEAFPDQPLDQYTVKMVGEIRIEQSGPIRFVDGVDDFAYLAIDINKSGVAGDMADEILINDGDWTTALATGNEGSPIVEAEFDVDDGGEWLAIEFNMAEGTGGDSSMLYWDALDTDDVFPLEKGDGIFEEDAIFLLVPDTHLQSLSFPAPLLSADINGQIPNSVTGWEFEVNPADGTSDMFTLENPDSEVFNTTLNIDGSKFVISVDGEVSEGDSFQIVVADNIVGTPTILTEGWTFDASTGFITFGAGPLCDPSSQGDLDGNGKVEFADFLVLSGNFGTEVSGHTAGDIDCNGKVEFADFLVLSGNFGKDVGAAENVPEPSGLILLGFAGLLSGCLRRRR